MAQSRNLHSILMADVIGSRRLEAALLSRHLQATVAAANAAFGGAILSPLTVTLGDEFQGLVENPRVGVDVILWLERRLRQAPVEAGGNVRSYRLRYVLHEGCVETPINRARAHGMLGSGLTRARELLGEKGRGDPRIRIALSEPSRSRRLGDLFAVLDALATDWKAEDFELIEAMLESDDGAALGRRFGRHRTSIDRRRHTLKIEAYLIIERLLRDLAS